MRPNIWLVTLSSLFFLSCDKNTPQSPSVIVVALENFSGIQFSCNPYEDSEKSGFKTLCNEAIRFTHAFAPSPLSQASLGAIVTGQHPLKNSLRDNGSQFLPAHIITIPERLQSQGVKTFISISSPTIKRNSRLHQGFQTFDDEYPMTHKSFFRPLSESRSLLIDWIGREAKGTPFLGIIHGSDLLFSHLNTQNLNLEPRGRGVEGQLEEVDEELYLLFEALRAKNLWDTSYIVVVGLNGTTNPSRINELPATNLFAENVQVPLFIKPLRGREEIPHQWKIDSHVALQDLGATIGDIFKSIESHPRINKDLLLGRSLLPLINGKSPEEFENTSLLIESAWGPWSKRAPYRYSVRDAQWLIFLDRKPSLYNTLTDRNEFNRISLKKQDYQNLIQEKLDLFGPRITQNYEKPRQVLSDEFRMAQLLLENENRVSPSSMREVETLVADNPKSETMQWLLVYHLAKQKKWRLINQFNKVWRDPIVSEFTQLTEPNPLAFLAKEKKDDICLLELKNKIFKSPLILENQCEESDYKLLFELMAKKELSPEDKQIDELSHLLRFKILQLNLILFDQAKGGIILGAQKKDLKALALFNSLLFLPKLQKIQTFVQAHLQ